MTAPADIQQRSTWRRALDAVFGYDFFISYAWGDGAVYATALMRRLEAQGFQVFLDREHYASGDDWKQVGAWTLRRTGQLILIGTAGALTSQPVARELDIFAATGRRILPIDFGGSLDRLADNVQARQHLQDQILRIREPTAALTAGPSEEAVATIRRTFTLVRQDKKRLMLAAGLAGVMTVLALASMFLAGYAQVQKTAAFENARQTFVRQADLSASIAFRLFSEGRPVLGFKVAREGAPDVIEYGTPLTARLSLALSRGWSQIHEEADLRHPDGNITNAIWWPDGSRAVTATLTDAPRVWSAATGELEATLGSGVRPDYVIMKDPSDLSFSLDGRRLATQLGDAATVWDTSTWTSILTTRCEASGGRLLRLSPDGKTVAAHCNDGTRVWDVATGRELHHRPQLPNLEGLTAFAFADGGDTLVHLGDGGTEVRILRHIASGKPELVSLKGISAAVQGGTPDQGRLESMHATRVPSEVVMLGPNAIYRVDIVKDRIVWQTAFSAGHQNWFQMLPAVDAIATAGVLENGDIEYQIARGPRGPLLYGGRIHLTGDHAGARINAVSFQDDGKGIALSLNTGVQIMALGPDGARPRGADAQKPEEQQDVVYSGSCSPAEAEASRIALLPDGSRMLATCSDGNAHMVRLKEPPIARLPGMQPIARFGSTMVRVAGNGTDTRFETVNSSGTITGQSEKIGEDVSYWLANEAGSNVLFVGTSGTVRSWRAGTPGFVTYGIRLAEIRAARFAPDGARVALLDGSGAFVRIRLGESNPESVSRVGAVVPAIDFAIDPTLSAVAFTTKDIEIFNPEVKPPASVDNMLAIVAVPGKDGARFSCRRSESTKYSAAIFSEVAREPTVYLVKRDRSIEKFALAGDANGLGACPEGLPDAFKPGLKWEINSFTHESVRIVEASDRRPARLIFSAAADTPLELIDLASNHSITDLSPIAGGNHPLALSSGGRYLAATGNDDRTIEVYDVSTGNLLRRLRTEQDVENDRGALLFAPGDQILLVRLASGSTVAYPLTLLEGTDLLEHVRGLGLAPLTDDETREIYDIRQRLSRPPAYGALSLPPPRGNA